MKNEEINLMNEEECWEKEYEIGPEDDDYFPMNPYDEDERPIHDRMLEDLYNETFGKYYERLQKEAEEEMYREWILGDLA